MANHSLSMKKLHTLIVYYTAGKSKRFIADALQISRHTVDNYLSYLKAEIGEDLSPLLSWDEESLNRLVNPQKAPDTQQVEKCGVNWFFVDFGEKYLLKQF